MNIAYVTGNEYKAKYFSEILGIEISHAAVEVDEVQSLDLVEVVSKKAKSAYEQIGRPVIVEDTSLIFSCLGRLPGTFIKWFLDEISQDGLCRLIDNDRKRQAVASAAFAYFDGNELKIFKGSVVGKIAEKPAGESGFGWNPIFIPDGHDQTLAQMNDKAFKSVYTKIKPFDELREFLISISA